MITVSTSVRTGSSTAISPSGLDDARITVIVGYAASQVTTASLKRERRGLGAGLPADRECATAAFNASRNRPDL
jgi:hypothetical protein